MTDDLILASAVLGFFLIVVGCSLSSEVAEYGGDVADLAGVALALVGIVLSTTSVAIMLAPTLMGGAEILMSFIERASFN